jgi:hypothetical protein
MDINQYRAFQGNSEHCSELNRAHGAGGEAELGNFSEGETELEGEIAGGCAGLGE